MRRTIAAAVALFILAASFGGICEDARQAEIDRLISEWTERYQEDPYWYPRGQAGGHGPQGQPADGDIAHEQALRTALGAVLATYDVAYDTLRAAYAVTTDFLDFDQPGVPESCREEGFPGHPRFWIVYISPIDFRTQTMDPYAVSIDAETGDILGIDVGYKG